MSQNNYTGSTTVLLTSISYWKVIYNLRLFIVCKNKMKRISILRIKHIVFI